MFIALLGSPFSSRYAREVRVRGEADPLSYCQVNVALYGRRSRRWVLTERAIRPAARDATSLAVGRSSLRWTAGELRVDVDEASPWTRAPLRGRLTFTPEADPQEPSTLDGEGRHMWWPVAPRGTLEVCLQEPDVRFRATGYHDANAGSEALHRAVSDWTWSRFHLPRGSTIVTYAVKRADGTRATRMLRLGPAGPEPGARFVTGDLARSRWGLAREAWAGDAGPPRLVQSLEDGPFYARQLVEVQGEGRRIRGLSETLSAARLATEAGRFFLGFRQRRES